MGSAVKDAYENEWLVDSKWTNDGECPHWSDATGQHERPPKRIVLPRGWQWCDDWKVDVSPAKAGKDGWVYGETLMAVRGHRGQAKPNPKWATAARRRRWYRPCQQEARGGGVSLEEASSTLDEVAMDLMAVKQHLGIVTELKPILGTTEEDMGVRSGINHAASKAKFLHHKCSQRLAREPDFASLQAHVHDADSAEPESPVWPPPPAEADANTQRSRVRGRWLAMRTECERLKPTVARAFKEVMELCGGSQQGASDGGGSGGGSSGGGSTERSKQGAGRGGSARATRGGHGAPRRRTRDGVSLGSSVSFDGSWGERDVREASAAPGPGASVPRADRGFSQLQDQEFCREAELQVCNELAAERGKAVQQIAKDVHDTSELFEDLSMIVASQKEPIDAIERRAQHAHAKTAEGVKHIEQAHKDSPGCAVM